MYNRHVCNYSVRSHGRDLFIVTLNCTSVTEHALEVADHSLTMTRAGSDAADTTNATMGTVIDQTRETLR